MLIKNFDTKTRFLYKVIFGLKLLNLYKNLQKSAIFCIKTFQMEKSIAF